MVGVPYIAALQRATTDLALAIGGQIDCCPFSAVKIATHHAARGRKYTTELVIVIAFDWLFVNGVEITIPHAEKLL